MFLSPEALTSLLRYSAHHGIPALKSVPLLISTPPNSSMMESRREAAQRPHTCLHSPPNLPASTQLSESATRWKQKPKTIGVWRARRGSQRERGVCGKTWAGLPARTSCSSAASSPGWARAGGPHLQAAPCTQAWPTCSPSWGLGGKISGQHGANKYTCRLPVESSLGPPSRCLRDQGASVGRIWQRSSEGLEMLD